MKPQIKLFAAAVLLSGIVFNAAAQIQMHSGGNITIRSMNNAARHTDNYGDLELLGGNQGMNWGWLWANRAIIHGPANIGSDLFVGGSVSGSVKNFIHPHPTDESKIIRYTSVESGEAVTLSRGIARTANGQATVKLPEHFSMTTSSNAPVTVSLTPKGAPVLLYTKQNSKEEIVVEMRKSDLTTFGDVEFAFLVTGVRDGFEKMDVVINAREFYSADFKDGWKNTEVGTRIKAHNERVHTWQENEREEKRRVAEE